MMQYNVCKTCLADNGRAGTLIDDECVNCYHTRHSGDIVVFSYLRRTDEELQRTFNIITNQISPSNPGT